MFDFLIAKNLIPTPLIKFGILLQLRQRLAKERQAYRQSQGNNKFEMINQLKQSQIALSPQTANQQHYEVPTKFFLKVLGPRLKYSCCSWQNAQTLQAAEEEMLALYCQRAEIEDGQTILDLGCGWGSLSLYLAEKYPNSEIRALSNSATQLNYIQQQALKKGYHNIETLLQDVNELKLSNQFDRILSVEMFEHVRNYQQLMATLASALNNDGKLFVHHFCHRQFIYPYNSDDSWMARHFFTDGLMPSEDLLTFFQDDLLVTNSWRVNGHDYSKTCAAWLENLDRQKESIIGLFEAKEVGDPRRYFQYWRLFFLACVKFFAFNDGREWFVAHYLFSKK